MKKNSLLLIILLLASCDNPSKVRQEPVDNFLYKVETTCQDKFYLPAGENFVVKDPKGNDVELFDNGFIPYVEGKYIAESKNYKYEITAKGTYMPVVNLEYYKKYVEEGTDVKLPDVCLNNNSLSYKEILKIGGRTYRVPHDRIIPVIGDVEYVITVNDGMNEIQKTSQIIPVPKGDQRLDLIVELSEEYGLEKQVDYLCGYDASYTTEMKYGDENGTLKLHINHDHPADQQIRFHNLLISDVSDADEIYCYVYNDTDNYMSTGINYGTFAVLLPHQWNYVSLTNINGVGIGSQNPIYKGCMTPSDIEGFCMGTFNTDWTKLQSGDLYFSSIYRHKRLANDDISSMLISATKDNMTEADATLFKNAEKYYYRVNDQGDEDIRPYYKEAARAYEAYLEKKYNYTPKAKTIIDSGTEFGLAQVETVNMKIENTTELYYGDSGHSFKVQPIDSWENKLRFLYPTECDATKWKKIYCYIYFNDETVTKGVNARLRNDDNGVILENGKWTRVELSDMFAMFNGALTTDIGGLTLWLFYDNWETMMPSGVEFYISPLYYED